MSRRLLSLLVLLFFLFLVSAAICQDRAGSPGPEPNTVQVYKRLLTDKDSTEQTRIEMATLLMFHGEAQARGVLLEVLGAGANGSARPAVCKALVKARAEQKLPGASEDFIEPLMDILRTEQDIVMADLAAAASLIFAYEQVSDLLEAIAADGSLPVRARLNAVGALKRPDIGAICQLIRLVDDEEQAVAAGAEQALRSLGVPVGADGEDRAQMLSELRRKGRDEFLRDWVVRQEGRIRQLESELDWWKVQLMEVLDGSYEVIEEDMAKGRFLAERLVSSKRLVRLWALKKVSEWRKGTNPKLPDELGPILVNLVSDVDRDVRLKTAELLSLMGELNAAGKLLEQHSVEQDDEVRTEIFVALGVACSHASMSNSIPAEVRKQALELAVEYLVEQDARKSQEGAEVIERLVGQNELRSKEVTKYLGLLSDRYEQEKDKVEGSLRGGLLGAMAGLCAQGSTCRAESARLFAGSFEEALTDKADLARAAAVDGLVYIDKSNALAMFRNSDLVNDSSIEIRTRLVNLAGELGGKEDLPWLWEKVGFADESRSAWDAMLKIFGRRTESAVLGRWMGEFAHAQGTDKLSDDQYLSFLEIAEQKAVGEGGEGMVTAVREGLAGVHRKLGDFEQAAKYYGVLHEVARTPEEKESILPDLLDARLRGQHIEMAASLIDNCLLEKDLDANSPVVKSIERYLSEAPSETDPNEVLSKVISRVKLGADRPKWQEQVRSWAARTGSVKGANERREAEE